MQGIFKRPAKDNCSYIKLELGATFAFVSILGKVCNSIRIRDYSISTLDRIRSVVIPKLLAYYSCNCVISSEKPLLKKKKRHGVSRLGSNYCTIIT